MEQQYEPTTVLHLPTEVLIMIFCHLAARDRKSVRRTCTQWNACAKTVDMAKGEKYKFSTNTSNVWEIERTMLDQTFFHDSLEFDGVNVSSLYLDVWEESGPKLRSLTFRNCLIWRPRTIKSILTRCKRLETLAVEINFQDMVTLYDRAYDWSYSALPDLLDHFIESNGQARTTSTNLHTFKVDTSDEAMSWAIVDRMILLYPTIRHLIVVVRDHRSGVAKKIIPRIGVIYPGVERIEVTDSYSTATYSRINGTKQEGEMEFGVTKLIVDNRFTNEWTDSIIFGVRLEHFDWTIRLGDNVGGDTLAQFISLSPNLRVVKLNLFNCDSEACSEITSMVLRTCPHLEEFIFRFTRPGQARRGLLWSGIDMSSLSAVPV